MSRWLIDKLDDRECHYVDGYAFKHYDDDTMRHKVKRDQRYTNQNERKAIKEISIHEVRNIDTRKIESRRIYVKFGDVFTQRELNNILAKRKLNQLSESDYQHGVYFNVDSHSGIKTLLSTLHEISPFSREMKIAIVNYLVPNMEEKKKTILRQDIFSKFTKVTSLFNLSLDKVNEAYSLSFVLPVISKISNEAKEVIVNHQIQKNHSQRLDNVSHIRQIPNLFNLCLEKVKKEFQPNHCVGFSLKPKV